MSRREKIMEAFERVGKRFEKIEKIEENKRLSELNKLFVMLGLKNKKGQHLKAININENERFDIINIKLPMGFDDDDLIKSKSKIESQFGYRADVVLDDYDCSIKLYKVKLEKRYDYKQIPIKNKKHFQIAFGMTLDGYAVCNLTKTIPHILCSGGTNMGKSMLIQGILLQAIETYSPEELEIEYYDNKFGLDANIFKNVAHIKRITRSAHETLEAMEDMSRQIADRMNLIAENDCQNIVQYNNKGGKMPFKLVVIDELYSFKSDLSKEDKERCYDLMATCGSIARACGVHLLFSTQRPTADVIPTEITTHCGIRIGLGTNKSQESKNIIEETGLERINEAGRGIYFTGEYVDFKTFLIEDEVRNKIISKHIVTKEIEAEEVKPTLQLVEKTKRKRNRKKKVELV